ncbi:MAG: carboxypeptidase-like regulatory domain-containing protein [Chitinophagia bacterium]|nr:carboxypeptidase-like regulatory domain-containing protein [Chitinophagia bacterium]
MRRYLLYLAFVIAVLPAAGLKLQAQTNYDNIVQINGVVMTADSLMGVPGVIVQVKNQNRGVQTENTGVFSLVCYKGDTLEFRCVGFRAKDYVLAKDIKGQYFSLIQLMVQDTFYLPETIIRALPTKGAFDYAFTHWDIPNDQYEIARRNTDAIMLRALAATLPKDGHEAQSAYLAQQARDAVYYGTLKPMNIFNPLAWAEFFESWKRGDFRKKKNPYTSKSAY